jgi:hypothetical protein
LRLRIFYFLYIKEFVMKKSVYGFTVIAVALVLGTVFYACDTSLSGIVNGPPVDNTGQTVTVNLGGTAYTLTVPKGTVIDDAYISAHKGELEGLNQPFALDGLALGLGGQAVTANGDISVPSVWKLNGVAVETWHTVTFTVNGETYPVQVPEGASLAAGDQAALEAFFDVPAGSLSGVTWSELSTITENKTPEAITVTTFTVTFDVDYETENKTATQQVVSGGSVATLPEPSERAGFSFGGWWTAKNGGGTAFDTATLVIETITVYAKWMEVMGNPPPPVDENLAGTSRYQAALIDGATEYVTFNDDQWTGDATGNETWHLSVLDRREVVFGVKKAAGQTVTASVVSLPAESGMLLSHGAITEVTEMPEGDDTVDGLVPSDTLAVFKVDANKVHNDKRENVATDVDAKYDTQFEGDDFRFMLSVDSHTVTVQLRADVTLDNALFVVDTATGALSRVDGIKHITNISDGTVTWDNTEPGTGLLDLLVWADQNYLLADGGTGEYLVRAANVGNETFPMMILTFAENNTTTKLRLRGTNGEQVIKWDGQSKMTNSIRYYNTAASTNAATPGNTHTDMQGLINIRGGTLQLEKNITIKGAGANDANACRFLIVAARNGNLIMKNGSAVKDFIGSGANKALGAPIRILGRGNPYTGTFGMEGGEISGHTSTTAAVWLAGTLQKEASLPYGNAD